MSSFRACARLDLFQPTLPARGATAATARNVDDGVISTHAPRTGSDALSAVFSGVSENFNPRSPHGERLTFSPPTSPISSISTHAPRTGSDATVEEIQKADSDYFNPRSPHGERPASRSNVPTAHDFNPRSPHGERHIALPVIRAAVAISTHAPRTGSDKIPLFLAFVQRHFNPRSPHGERLCWIRSRLAGRHFNPRSPHGERLEAQDAQAEEGHFNPRSPHGERPSARARFNSSSRFQPTLPARGATSSSRKNRSKEKFQPTLPARGATRGIQRI